VLRFPLNPGDVQEKRAWLEAEADAARSVLGRLPVPSSEPVALGEPGHGYPLPWVVYRWLPGNVPSTGSVALAGDLAEVVHALRAIDTGGRRLAGEGRGGLLADADPYVAAYLDDADGMIDTDALRGLWVRLSRTPHTTDDVWTHGDLMPGNLLVADGRLSAVIDVGGAGPADPALDLQSAWNLLDAPSRAAFRAALDTDDAEWDRGKAWSLAQAIGCLAYYRATNPPMSATARRTLEALIDDESDADRRSAQT